MFFKETDLENLIVLSNTLKEMNLNENSNNNLLLFIQNIDE